MDLLSSSGVICKVVPRSGQKGGATASEEEVESVLPNLATGMMSSVEAVHPGKTVFTQECELREGRSNATTCIYSLPRPLHVRLMVFNHKPLKSVTQNNPECMVSENEKPRRRDHWHVFLWSIPKRMSHAAMSPHHSLSHLPPRRMSLSLKKRKRSFPFIMC